MVTDYLSGAGDTTHYIAGHPCQYMDAIAPFQEVRQLTTAEKLNVVLIEIFGAVPIEKALGEVEA